MLYKSVLSFKMDELETACFINSFYKITILTALHNRRAVALFRRN